jgi:trans-2,3-dihydro-3-hydroxyanthranilate isomerase
MSSRTYRYRVVDVFTQNALEGNQLGVFPEATGIDDATMQRIAKELNIAETTFILPATRPDCVANVRIFTPAREMPFAGHPTVGSSFVLMDEGVIPRETTQFSLDEKVGAIPVRVEKGEHGRPLIWLTTPAITYGKTCDPKLCAEALGIEPADLHGAPPQIVGAGNPAVFVAVKDKDVVDRAWLDSRGMASLKNAAEESVFAFVFAPTKLGAYSRMFAPEHGVAEDPATGSATGPLAAYMMRHGLIARGNGSRFISEQGAKMKRRSILHIQIDWDRGTDAIEVGGYVSPIIEGKMTLPDLIAD